MSKLSWHSPSDLLGELVPAKSAGAFRTDVVARYAVFLAGFSSNALTGQSVVVNHGWSMH